MLQRIAIRLYVVLRMGQVQRRMAVQTILTCLVLEQGRLVEAQKNISVRDDPIPVQFCSLTVHQAGTARRFARTFIQA